MVKNYRNYAYKEEKKKNLSKVLWYCYQENGCAFVWRMPVVREIKLAYIVANSCVRYGNPTETYRLPKDGFKDGIYKTDFKHQNAFFALNTPKDFWKYRDIGDYWMLNR